MADSFNKKEREKKRRKRKQEKAERKLRRKEEGVKSAEFMYVDQDGNLHATPPDPSQKLKVSAEDIDISVPKQEKSEVSKFARNGIVKFFDTSKGYGFITDSASGQSLFVHMENLVDRIKENDKVTFEVGSGPKGKIALKVKLS